MRMKFTIACLVYLLASLGNGFAEDSRYDDTICGSSRLRLHTRQELAALSDAEGHTAGADFELDLTGDAQAEYLSGAECGNAGCQYAIYLQERPGQFRCVGEVFLHRKGFIRIVDQRHNDFFDILAYSHLSAARGSLLRLEFDGRRYKVVHRLDGAAVDLYPLIGNSVDGVPAAK